ncbi:hypothetical protein OUZ56_023700 [Daphnia magna]|uniref:Uncharacterized protein n=1 Tax=Daphnia magna TaxID=35525 RepID=A0ABR0AZA4_9CRUS|nr:hypothetical protein OUZ56_023700 [Daphnia magna]
MEVLFSRKKLSYTRSAPEMASRLSKSQRTRYERNNWCQKRDYKALERLLKSRLTERHCLKGRRHIGSSRVLEAGVTVGVAILDLCYATDSPAK